MIVICRPGLSPVIENTVSSNFLSAFRQFLRAFSIAANIWCGITVWLSCVKMAKITMFQEKLSLQELEKSVRLRMYLTLACCIILLAVLSSADLIFFFLNNNSGIQSECQRV